MAFTKSEQRKLRSMAKRAKKIESDARKLGRDVGKELKKQMRES